MKHAKPFVWRISIASFILLLLIGLPLSAIPRQDDGRNEKLARFGGEFVCGTTLDGSIENQYLEALFRHERNLRRLEQLRQQGLQPKRAALSADIGDIAVIEDDGTLVMPSNPFDLDGQTILYTPNPAGGYDVSSTTTPLDNEVGTKITQFSLGLNDGFAQVPFGSGFQFPFFGVTYTGVFVGTNGYLTFVRGDTRPDADVVRFLLRPPRIAAFWSNIDLTPVTNVGSSGVFVKQLADRLVVTYRNVPVFGLPSTRNTFQVTLFADGQIAINYFRMRSFDALVGISPGTGTAVQRNQINFSELPQAGLVGAILEFFRFQAEVDFLRVPGVFYRTHGDDFDFLYIWTDFDYDLGGGAFARYFFVRNDAQGIGLRTGEFNGGPAAFGSAGRLQGLLEMSDIVRAYPSDPNARFLGLNSALSILGQEQGHRWLSFISYASPDSTILLGRSLAHWNFFLNIESTNTFSSPDMPRSSSVEGNVWIDNGNGTFSTPSNLRIDGYAALDQYVMGLRASNEVPDTFVITNPTLQRTCFGTVPEGRDCPPQAGVTTGGTRLNVSIDRVIAANGPRVPGVETSQKAWRAAFILLLQPGATVAQSTLDKLNLYRTAWDDYFYRATDFRGRIDTRLSN
jgi:hypothetical protein